MIAIGLCGAAFIGCFVATRQALWAGIAASLAVGYLYGIIRANLANPAAQFVYDAAIAGVFLAALAQRLDSAQRWRLRRLMPWVICLIGWPTMLLLVPSQNPWIQLVGWRGNVLFVPFILLGGLLDENTMRRLARSIGWLNLAVLLVAFAEVIWGVPRFYPFNAVDAIIYKSTDVTFNGVNHYRIPATFTHSAAYATCMVASIPLLVGALSLTRLRGERWFLLGAVGASAIGVFLAASRSEAVVLITIVMVTTVALGGRRIPRMAWVVLIIVIAAIVAATPRLQRFFTLANPEVVTARLHSSVNGSIIDLIEEYPLGNGLGGGGTSIPYFLKPLLHDPVAVENEYGRIVLEQGLPGLLIWLGFMFWVLIRSAPDRNDPWYVGRWLARLFCLISFATAPLGTGLLNAIPQTALTLMYCGWIATSRQRPRLRTAPRRPAARAVAASS
ncbi:MAG TPA: hypothetical protein VFB15_08825 [Candidatus Binataceae bacterium]|nr:hypothetical protein [Candidatus Binataceae bacterium]